MNFLETILHRLGENPAQPVLQEARAGKLAAASAGELLTAIRTARAFLARAELKRGDRCALLAHNSIRWAALDLAVMTEGLIAVPLYARQAPHELVKIMKDCSPALVCCGDANLRDATAKHWPDPPRLALFDEIFDPANLIGAAPTTPPALIESDPVTIIYTSGTSGEAKGVILTTGNLNHMIPCTQARLDQLMESRKSPERVFHYLPFCFAGSWILLLTCLSRNALLTLSTDLTKLPEEMKLAAPDYFLNVPAVLERIRSGVDEQLSRRGGFLQPLFQDAKAACARRDASKATLSDRARLALAKVVLFPMIRRRLGRNLKALICGSAPLAPETQLFFRMLGIPVLQVYGLTETTAICTMDDPSRVEPGRVGPAIPGIEMKLGENNEILVRGPNIFPGYWNQPGETTQALRGGWFHTGDQGEVNEAGNWRIIGRLKNLIILSSGHNIAPEPIEDSLLRALPEAKQVMLVGNNRSHLAAIVAGPISRRQVEAALAIINARLPHYECIRAFLVHHEPFSAESGLITANGKLRRDAIAAQFQGEIERLYRKHRP